VLDQSSCVHRVDRGAYYPVEVLTKPRNERGLVRAGSKTQLTCRGSVQPAGPVTMLNWLRRRLTT
jgi:hypothetical protein